MKKIALLIVMLAMILLPLLSETDAVKKRFELTGEGQAKLEFVDVDGDVTIRAHDKNEIVFEFTKELKGNATDSLRDYYKQIEPQITQNGNSVEIKIHYPKRSFNFSSIFKSGRVEVLSRLLVPKNIDANIRLVDGNIDARGIEGELHFHTVDGNLEADDCSGAITAGTVDGSIKMTNLNGSVEAKSVDGDISVSGVLNRITYKSVDGDAEFELRPGSQLKGACTFNVVDGDIDIKIPADLSFKLNAHTNDGDINMGVDLDKITLKKKNKLEGSKGSSEATLDIHTVDGDISITAI